MGKAVLATPAFAPSVAAFQGTDEASALVKWLFRSFDGSLALRL